MKAEVKTYIIEGCHAMGDDTKAYVLVPEAFNAANLVNFSLETFGEI